MRIVLCVGLLLSRCDASPEPAALEDDDRDVEVLELRLEQAEARIDALEKRLRGLEATGPAPDLEVSLPASRTPASGRVSIAVTPSQTFVDQHAVAHVALRAHLEAMRAENPDASVVIRADATVDHQRVVETMKVIKEAGFERISIATRSED